MRERGDRDSWVELLAFFPPHFLKYCFGEQSGGGCGQFGEEWILCLRNS